MELFDISVIICAHKSVIEVFAGVADSLKAQTLLKEQWELLFVDDASRALITVP